MKLTGKIDELKYEVKCAKDLEIVEFCKNFDINEAPPVFLLKKNGFSCSVSKWVSPKRTRSYPFERVYDSLACPLRATIIPVVKDEGADGDRDFVQWDTVALMSLLNVYVILAYYDEAEINSRSQNKITKQKFNNAYVSKKLEKIMSGSYHSSALHGEKGLDKLLSDILKGTGNFIDISRKKSKEAQNRETKTIQPKEAISSGSKASLTIINYLGGEYNLTVDEVEIKRNNAFLIECKHSANGTLPSVADVKDGLLKMILYSNLKEVKSQGKSFLAKPVLKLTSKKIASGANNFIECVIDEAQKNNFELRIEGLK